MKLAQSQVQFSYLAKLALFTAAYYLTGRLGLLFTDSSGFATTIWPPSGIALAAVLAYGYRYFPVALMGSFLINVFVAGDQLDIDNLIKPITIAVIIAIGATLQAIISAYLIKRYASYDKIVERDKDITLFLLLGGPIGCLINASIAISTLYLADMSLPKSYALYWFVWWAGDAIGVAIFAPLIIVLLRPEKSLTHGKKTLTMLLLSIVFATIVIFFSLAIQSMGKQIQKEFEKEAKIAVNQLKKETERGLDQIESITRFYQASEFVSRQEFEHFVTPPLKHYPAIQALEWIPKMPHHQYKKYQENAQKDGYDFQITERQAQGVMRPTPKKEVYYPIYYVEPLEANKQAFGFDVSSTEERRKTLDQARDSGNLTASPRLDLVQRLEGQHGFSVSMPIYDTKQPLSTPKQRQEHLKGFASGVFCITNLVELALKNANWKDFNIIITDLDAPQETQALYTSIKDSHQSMKWTEQLKMANRTWQIELMPTEAYIANEQGIAFWVVLIGDLIFTYALAILLLTVTGRTTLIEQLVEERTAALKKVLHDLRLSNQELENFTRIASHDLRSPLVNIKGFACELERSTEEVQKVIKQILPEIPPKDIFEILKQ